MRLFSTTRLSLLPSSQSPTLMCSSHSPHTERFGPREPLTKLSGLASPCSVTSPMTAKPLKCTAPGELVWSWKREVGTTEYQLPAPCRVTLWTQFFFFQAEDGIRDADVTGVQTCALPI